MQLNIRVGNCIADLTNINRVTVEEINGVRFLVGVRSSGRRIALFALREQTTNPHDTREIAEIVMHDICRALDGCKRVCVLTGELIEISDWPTAERALEAANEALDTPTATGQTEKFADAK